MIEFIDDPLRMTPQPWVEQSKTFEIYLPLAIVSEIVDKQRLAQISREKEYLMKLKQSLKDSGQIYPGKLLIKSNKIIVKEGHHRYLCLFELGAEGMRFTVQG